MNRPELWTAAAAASPLLSYLLGRFSRWGGLAAGAALFAFASFMLAGEISAGALRGPGALDSSGPGPFRNT